MYVCACDRPPEWRLCLRRRGPHDGIAQTDGRHQSFAVHFSRRFCSRRHCREHTAGFRCQLSKRGSAWLIRPESPTATSRPSIKRCGCDAVRGAGAAWHLADPGCEATSSRLRTGSPWRWHANSASPLTGPVPSCQSWHCQPGVDSFAGRYSSDHRV